MENLRWKNSDEYQQALVDYVAGFPYSSQFRNARHAYRRRINGRPNSDKTT